MNHFVDFLRANGLMPRDIVADGKWRRCPTETHPKKRNGAYKLADSGTIGWCQDHAVHPEPLTWKADKEFVAPKIDQSVITRRRSEERRELIRATHAAREFFLNCKPLRAGHSYLEDHGLDMTGCSGLRMDDQGWLVVPAMMDRNLMSVQRISPVGEKRFWPGASVKGSSYTIDRPGATVSVLCEGLATGLAIFAAAHLTRIIVAFDAGNLSRAHFPSRGMAVVAADNDLGTAARIGINPGIKAAQEAANAIGCGVAIPEGILGTDWCDYRQEKLAARMENRGRQSDIALRRAVDAEIAAAIMRNATFLRRAA